MLQQRQHRHRVAGPERRLKHQAREVSPGGVFDSGVPPESSARTPKRKQFGRDAARQFAVAGDQRGVAAGLA